MCCPGPSASTAWKSVWNWKRKEERTTADKFSHTLTHSEAELPHGTLWLSSIYHLAFATAAIFSRHTPLLAFMSFVYDIIFFQRYKSTLGKVSSCMGMHCRIEDWIQPVKSCFSLYGRYGVGATYKPAVKRNTDGQTGSGPLIWREECWLLLSSTTLIFHLMCLHAGRCVATL